MVKTYSDLKTAEDLEYLSNGTSEAEQPFEKKVYKIAPGFVKQLEKEITRFNKFLTKQSLPRFNIPSPRN